jgi:hypothetical protein
VRGKSKNAREYPQHIRVDNRHAPAMGEATHRGSNVQAHVGQGQEIHDRFGQSEVVPVVKTILGPQ